MKIDKDALDEALEWFKQDMAQDRTLEQFTENNITEVLKAAQFLSVILPHIERMAEARKKASEGVWWHDSTGITVQPPNGGSYALDFRTNANGIFVVSAANELSEIVKVMEKK